MSQLAETQHYTLADAIHALGDVPLHRVRWNPHPGTAVENHLLESQCCELVEGCLVEKSVGCWKGVLEAAFGTLLLKAAGKDRVAVTMASGPYRMSNGSVRCPDIGAIYWNRLRDGVVRIPEVAPVAPDLVFEIPTEENSVGELARKRREFFASGTRLLWEIDIEHRTAIEYRDPNVGRPLTADAWLDASDVIPNVKFRIVEAFDYLEPPEDS